MNKIKYGSFILIMMLLLTACNGEGTEEDSSEAEESLEQAEGLKEDQDPEEGKEDTQKDEGELNQEESDPKEENNEEVAEEREDDGEEDAAVPSVEEIQNRYEDLDPEEWGERVRGVKTGIKTEERIAALTFDACGGPNGRGYDEELISYLIEMDIPATLFISADWLQAHPDKVVSLWENPNFDIANHGEDHKPLSVSGRSAYGISGTASVEEVYHEVHQNHLRIKELTGYAPKFFRSGTAYYDEVAVKIIEDLGEVPVNYNVLGDAGATFSSEQIYNRMIQAEPGSIMLFHMNHPDSEVAEGVKVGVQALLEEGFEFVLLKDYIEELQ